MKVAIDPGSQLSFKPLNEKITEELEFREGNKEYVYNLTPFVRVSCLQEVSYNREELEGKGNNLRGIEDSVLVNATTFNGFQFIFNNTYGESYGEVQKIGNTLDGDDVIIKNPRRVPPPVLTTFTANVGEGSDFFTTAQLQFTANSLEQLQFLVPFLFNPGNTIFVEFGHNTDMVKNNISLFDSDDARALVQSSIIDVDCNSISDAEEGFIERMNKRIFETNGSYEYFFGIINNFDFSLNDSLGYDCTVDLIAASKMKLIAPNTDSPNVVSSDDGISSEVASLTLDSKLKTFIDKLYELNEKSEKDRIFSFDAADTSKYIRLWDIFAFLNGEYGYDIDPNNIRLANENFLTRNNAAVQIEEGISGRKREFDNILGTDQIISVKKANYSRGEPPIVSYSDDVLLFRNKMWNPPIYYNERAGAYGIVKDSNLQFVNGSVFLKESDFEVNNSKYEGEGGDIEKFWLTRVNTNFDTIRPYLMDESSNDSVENLYHSYISFDKFRSIYLGSEGKILDVIKKLMDLINEATDGMWNLTFIGDAYTPAGGANTSTKSVDDVDETQCEKYIATLTSLDSYGIQGGNTYTFKANSKDSVFTSMEFSLGLDGLLGDQIYMNALNFPDGSSGSQKMNLLLFGNHENNLTIKDKRNYAISTEMSKLNTNRGTNESNQQNGDSTVDSVRKDVASDIKHMFKGRYSVGIFDKNGVDTSDTEQFVRWIDNTKVQDFGGILKSGIPNPVVRIAIAAFGARLGQNLENLNQNPTEYKLEDLRQFYLKYDYDDVPVLGDNGLQLVENGIRKTENKLVPKYTRSEIIDNVFSLYDLRLTPLTFGPLKKTITDLRAKKNSNYQPSGEKATTDDTPQRTQRSFQTGGINPLLEAQLNISLPGIGGINPLNYVKVDGVPDVFAERGDFCVMDVAHTITPTNWETQISTRFRITSKDE